MKYRTVSSYAFAGAFFGLLVLAPAAMILSHLVHGNQPAIAMPVREVYTSEFLIWTVPFTLLAGAVGALFGLGVAGLRERTLQVEQGRRYVETLFNSVGEGLMSIDGGYRIQKANRAFLSQSGYADEKEVQGKECWEVLHRNSGPCKDVEYCAVREVFSSGEEGSCVHTHFTKDGSELDVEISAYPVLGPDGTVSQAVTVIRDLTDRRRAEEKSRAYTRQIEHSNYLKGLFTDILSHDLLNPAMVTSHMAEMLAHKLKDSEPEEIPVLRRNARKLLTLLKDASKFARMEALDTLTIERCDVIPLVSEAIERFGPSFAEKRIELNLESDERVFARINPLFEEVMNNLLSNALKYSPEGTAVTVKVAPVEKGIDITVTDQGEGVPDGFKRTIFERFERAGDLGVKGSGLGLAIARRIVDLHDGTIWVEDGIDRGSVFHVFLPGGEQL